MMNHWNDLRRFKEEHVENISSCFLIGSLVYKNPSKESDIDLLIVGEVAQWRYLCEILPHLSTTFIKNSTNLLKTTCEYGCLKFERNHLQYSVDFVPINNLEKMIQDTSKKESSAIYDRVTHKPQQGEYNLKSGKKRSEFAKQNIKQGPCVKLKSPLHVYQRHYYWGILADKLISGHQILWDNMGISKLLRRISKDEFYNLIQQSHINDERQAIKSLVRFESMPRLHIESRLTTLLEPNFDK